MRMTNEQFQAEVFRRSRVYQEQRQIRRRRMFAGTLAFAGCFAVVILAARVLPNKNYETANRTADVAERADNSESYAADAAADEACEECSEENYAPAAECEAEAGDEKCKIQHANNTTAAANDKDAKQDTAESASDGAEEYFAEMTDEELFAYYGIEPLPESLSILTYAGSSRNGEYSENEKAGVLYADRSKKQVLSDTNFFWYQAADGRRLLSIHFQLMNDSGAEIPEIDYVETGKGEAAYFTVGNLLVDISTECLNHAALVESAEALKAHLMQ